MHAHLSVAAAAAASAAANKRARGSVRRCSIVFFGQHFVFLSALSPDVALLNHYVGREETMACSVFNESGSPILPPPIVSPVISSGN